METAKVDIRKLQLLNDRINQCIDALNQVRLSVHGLSAGAGLSHTSPFFPGVNPGIPTGLGPYGQFAGGPGQFPASPIGPGQFPISPISAYQQGVTPFGTIGASPIASGLSHTSGGWGANLGLFGQPNLGLFGQGVPFGQGINPYGVPFGAEGIGGTDPMLGVRIAQTFPYAQLPTPPVVTLY